MPQTFRNIEQESLFFRQTQLTKYTHLYSITFQIPMAIAGTGAGATYQDITPNNQLAIMQIMEDAAFHITHISGSVTSPVDVNGVRLNAPTPTSSGATAAALGFPMAGTTNRSDRGLRVSMIQSSANQRLTLGEITRNQHDLIEQTIDGNRRNYTLLDVGSLITPGYGYEWGKPVPFHFFLDRGKRLNLNFQNWDTSTTESSYHRVSFAFIGNRYE